jgi:monoamine oxidase
MPNRIDRRKFLAAAGATVASPALAVAQTHTDADVIVVGAGAAGIAAARKVIAAGRRCIVLEASDRIGGRCFTDTRTFGVPYDRGAHSIYRREGNAIASLARSAQMELYAAPVGLKLRVGRRGAREGELEDFLATLVRANRAIRDGVRPNRDVPASQLLAKEAGEWRPTVEFIMGPYSTGKNLEEVSAQDFSRELERDVESYCRQGYGALIAKLGATLPVRLGMAVRRIATWRGISYVETNKGTVAGRSCIVTASTAVLAAGKIRFDPDLPKRHADAFAKLSLGTYERVALELPGNPLGLEADDLVFEKAAGPRTAGLLANINRGPLCFVDVAGKFGRGLATEGPAAMQAFALDWLAGLFGNAARKVVGRSHVTQWSKEPWILGSTSAAVPGGQPSRRALAEPHRDRVFFAGEAVHETLWGTVGGAWESGETAANAAIRVVGGPSRRK